MHLLQRNYRGSPQSSVHVWKQAKWGWNKLTKAHVRLLTRDAPIWKFLADTDADTDAILFSGVIVEGWFVVPVLSGLFVWDSYFERGF